MTVTVRRAEETDLDDLTSLARQMDAHYGTVDVVAHDDAKASIGQALFGPQPLALAFIARVDTVAAGMAFVARLFPTKDFRPGLFIKDIYVADTMRRRGVAQSLIAAIAGHARTEGYTRIDWTTDLGNDAAIRLYDSLETRDPTKLFFRLREEDYGRLID